jgi:hypothetical protein
MLNQNLGTTIPMGYDHKLTVLAPGKASPIDGQPAWQILIHGTPEPGLASEGVRFPANAAFSDICIGLEEKLCSSVSRKVVVDTWGQVLAVLEVLYNEYAQRHNPSWS